MRLKDSLSRVVTLDSYSRMDMTVKRAAAHAWVDRLFDELTYNGPSETTNAQVSLHTQTSANEYFSGAADIAPDTTQKQTQFTLTISDYQ